MYGLKSTLRLFFFFWLNPLCEETMGLTETYTAIAPEGTLKLRQTKIPMPLPHRKRAGK